MPAHTYFFIINGFHNTSHTLVLLLSCYDCAVDLKSTNGQRIVRIVYETKLYKN